MSNGVANLARRPIDERSTTTILRQQHTATATTGNVVTTTPVGPVSGKKWLITNAVASGRYLENPDANDGGSCTGNIVNGGTAFALVGASVIPDSEESIQYTLLGPGAPPLVMEFGDEIELVVDAADSDTADIAGVLDVWGFEYDDIV